MRPFIVALVLAFGLPLCAPARETLPAELMQAKTVYIEMGAFVPTKSKGDHGQQASYLGPCEKELEKWGRLKIVNDPKQADVILRISSVATGGSASYSTAYPAGIGGHQPDYYFRRRPAGFVRKETMDGRRYVGRGLYGENHYQRPGSHPSKAGRPTGETGRQDSC